MARLPTSANVSVTVQKKLGGVYEDVTIVADNIDAVVDVSNALGNGDFSDIIANLPEILMADDNAAIATQKALEAEDSATEAQTSADISKASETEVLASEDRVTILEASASVSAISATTSELLASRWATEVVDTPIGIDKYSALHYATKAGESKEAAKLSETNAKTSEINAGVSEVNADISDTSAAAHSVEAGAQATASGTSATSSASSSLTSRNWAIHPKNTIIPAEGEYSSKHYALTAKDEAKRAQDAADSLSGTPVYQGTWDASMGVYPPDQPVGFVGTQYYIVNAQGIINGDLWLIGDQMIWDNVSSWNKVPSTTQVLSVNGEIGDVLLDSSEIPFDSTGTLLVSSDVNGAIRELDKRADSVITHVVRSNFVIPNASLENFSFVIIQVAGTANFTVSIPDYAAPSGTVIEAFPIEDNVGNVNIVAIGAASITAGTLYLPPDKRGYVRLVTTSQGIRSKKWLPSAGRFVGSGYSSSHAAVADYEDVNNIGATNVQTALGQVVTGRVVDAKTLMGESPEAFANTVHTHTISDTTGLQGELDLKLPSSNYTATDILAKLLTVDGTSSNLDADLLDGLEATAFSLVDHEHNYTIADIQNLQVVLNSKLDTSNYTAADILAKLVTVDGAGSGLSADTLRGLTDTDFAAAIHTHIISDVSGLQAALDSKAEGSDYTAADVLAKLLTVDGTGSGVDADLLDGLHATAFAPTVHTHTADEVTDLQPLLDVKLDATAYTAADVLAKLRTVDGANTGLDADTLDGIQAASFAKTAINLTAGAGLSGGGNLTSNRTFTVNADRGLDVLNDRVGIDILTDGGLNTSGGLGIDISKAKVTTAINGTNELLIDAGGVLKRITRDNLVAGISGGIQIRGSALPVTGGSSTIIPVSGDPLNATITQGVEPTFSGVDGNGYTYIVMLQPADKTTGVTLNFGGSSGSPISITVFDQDQLTYAGDQWIHLETGDSVISVFGRTGIIVAENNDYTGNQVTNIPAGAITATNTQAAINELDTNKVDNSRVLTNVPIGAVFTDEQNPLSNSVVSTSQTTSATSLAAKTANDRANVGVRDAASAQTTANTAITNAATAQSTADAATTLANTKLDASIYTAADILNKVKTVDGSGSGLDADTLDGLQASALARATHTHTIANITSLQAALDNKLEGSSYTANDILAKIKTVDGSGSGLDADLLDGKQSSSGATANTVAVRDSSADIQVRLLRSIYPDQTTISGAMAFRVSNGSDNFNRYCSDKGAIRTYLGVYAKGEALAIGAKAADSNLLDGKDSLAFITYGSGSYSQILGKNNSASDWLRTTTNGLLPSANGAGALGTSSWRFSSIYGNTIYEGTTSLSNKYLGKTAKAADSQLLDGIDSTSFARTATNFTAGNGLSGGGTLAANRTFAVNTNRGISIASDKVGINLPSNSGLSAGTQLTVDIKGTAPVTTAVGNDELLLHTASGIRAITRDNLLAGVSGGITLRGSANPISGGSGTTFPVTGDALNISISQGTAPTFAGVSADGYTYIVQLRAADKPTGVTAPFLGATGSATSTTLFDQDQLVWIGNQWYHLETGDAIINVFGRTGAITANSGDYTAAKITSTPYGSIGSTNVQAAIQEIEVEINGKVDNSRVLTNVPSGAVFTDTQNTLSSSVSSTSTTVSANSAAARSAYNRGSLGVTNAATAQATADGKLGSGANAVSATKLKTARTIDITGDITATAVAFDGTKNIAISAVVNNNSHTHTLANVTGLVTALDGKVDDAQVLTNVPAGAKFTDTNTWRSTSDSVTSTSSSVSASSKAAKTAYDRGSLGVTNAATALATAKTAQTTADSKLSASAYTAANVLAKLKTVDGSGSGLDADTLDGQTSGAFLRSNATDTASGEITFSNAKGIKLGGSGTSGSAGNLRYLSSSDSFEGYTSANGWGSIGGGGVPEFTLISSDTTAVLGTAYVMDVSSVSHTLTLPTAVAGDWVIIGDYDGSCSILNAITITSTQNIHKKTDDLVLTNANVMLTLSYIDSNVGWKIVDGIGEDSGHENYPTPWVNMAASAIAPFTASINSIKGRWVDNKTFHVKGIISSNGAASGASMLTLPSVGSAGYTQFSPAMGGTANAAYVSTDEGSSILTAYGVTGSPWMMVNAFIELASL